LGLGRRPPLHVALGVVIRRLRNRGAANDEKARRCNGYYVLSGFHLISLFLSFC